MDSVVPHHIVTSIRVENTRYDMNLQHIKMSIQLFYYIIQQSVTKQIHQLGKAIFMAVSLATTKNDNRMVMIASKYPNLTTTHVI